MRYKELQMLVYKKVKDNKCWSNSMDQAASLVNMDGYFRVGTEGFVDLPSIPSSGIKLCPCPSHSPPRPFTHRSARRYSWTSLDTGNLSWNLMEFQSFDLTKCWLDRNRTLPLTCVSGLWRLHFIVKTQYSVVTENWWWMANYETEIILHHWLALNIALEINSHYITP